VEGLLGLNFLHTKSPKSNKEETEKLRIYSKCTVIYIKSIENSPCTTFPGLVTKKMETRLLEIKKIV